MTANDMPPSLLRMLTHERLSRLLIGVSILTGLVIGQLVTPWGYLILVAIALNLVQFAFTGKCKVKEMLDKLGVPYEHPPEHLVADPTSESDKKIKVNNPPLTAWERFESGNVIRFDSARRFSSRAVK